MAKYILLALVVLLGLWAAFKWQSLRAAWLSTRKFLQETRVEMQKVTWPTRNEVIGSLVVVLVAVLFLTVYVIICDQILSVVLDFVLQRGGV